MPPNIGQTLRARALGADVRPLGWRDRAAWSSVAWVHGRRIGAENVLRLADGLRSEMPLADEHELRRALVSRIVAYCRLRQPRPPAVRKRAKLARLIAKAERQAQADAKPE